MEKITKIIYESLPKGIRPIRRPREKWKGQVHKGMRKMGLEEDAGDRESWQWVVGLLVRLSASLGTNGHGCSKQVNYLCGANNQKGKRSDNKCPNRGQGSNR